MKFRVAVTVLWSAGIAYGQVPATENLGLSPPTDLSVNFGPVTSFVDLPETEKTVTMPAGTVVILWDLTGFTTGGEVKIRPVIGGAFPTNGLWQNSGSWVGHTNGGTVTVKLQVGLGQGAPFIVYAPSTMLSWTLMVFPEAGTVPAVSGAGLGVMSLLLLTAGTWIWKTRRRQAA